MSVSVLLVVYQSVRARARSLANNLRAFMCVAFMPLCPDVCVSECVCVGGGGGVHAHISHM